MSLRSRIRPWLRHVAPVAKVIETATSVLGQLQHATVFGVANAVAGGMREVGELIGEDDGARWCQDTAVPYGTMVEGLRLIGAEVREEKDGRSVESKAYHEDREVHITTLSEIWYTREPRASGDGEWMRKVIDAVLPPVVTLRCTDGQFATDARELTKIRTPAAAEIWLDTRELLEGGRTILLNGRPGCGKTTIAEAIARDCNLGRVVIVDPSVFALHTPGFSRPMIATLSPGVIIVDDVDKVDMSLLNLELFRSCARLVILTANNGSYDTVLDGAMMRPARVDEVFEVVAHVAERRPPFDRLTDEEWAEISDWPIAYQNEVAKRLTVRADDIRLEDLRRRLNRRTRSKGQLLHEAEDDDEDDEDEDDDE